MNQIEYHVSPRSGKSGTIYALWRVGIRGGTTTVTVYADEDTANRVAAVLNSARSQEVTGR